MRLGLRAGHGCCAVDRPFEHAALLARLDPMPDARELEQGRVHQRARAHHDATPIEPACDRLEQRPAQAAAGQRAAEADESGALRRRLVSGEAAEAAEAGAVV